MKKSIFLAIFVLFSVLAISSYAVEITLLGPKQYVRTDGAPNIYTDSFPGMSGQGRIIIKNGGVDGTSYLSSAIIKINGTQILGVNDFNQNVLILERTLTIHEENTISVELRSKPGSFLAVEIKESILGSAAGVADVQGGQIEVLNPLDPLFGLCINVPQGALDKSVVISVNPVSNLPQPPDYVRATSTSIELLPNGLVFNPDYPVEVTIPYTFSGLTPEDFVFALNYDSVNSSWLNTNQLNDDRAQNRLTICVSHFSPYQAMVTTPNFYQSAYIGFILSSDQYPVSQEGPNCRGLAGYTNWYFRFYGHGLACAYSYSDANEIQALAHEALKPFYPGFPILGGGEQDSSVASKLWLGLKNEQKPQLLSLKLSYYVKDNLGHMVVVYKYEYDSNSGRGFFYVMDPMDPASTEKIEYVISTGDLLDYQFDEISYKIFRYNQWNPSGNQPLQNIFNQYNRIADSCEPPGTNLIPNPSFEEGPIYWYWGIACPKYWFNGPMDVWPIYVWDASISHTGTRSIGILGCPYALYEQHLGTWQMWNNDGSQFYIPLKPYTQYEISVWFRWDRSPGPGEYAAVVLDHGPTSYMLGSSEIGSWVYWSKTFTTGPGFTNIYPQFWRWFSKGIPLSDQAKIWFDDFKLIEK